MPQTPPFTGVFPNNAYNKNLYQTKEENYGGLYYHDNTIVSGSLEALIQHLVPTVDYYPDVSPLCSAWSHVVSCGWGEAGGAE